MPSFTQSSSQCRDYDYYDEGPDSEGYISCCENKGTSLTEPLPMDRNNARQEGGGSVRVCNLCDLDLIKRSNSELGSASDVFTDSEMDDSIKASPLSIRIDYSTVCSHKSGSDSDLMNDFSLLAVDGCDVAEHTVVLQREMQSLAHPGYLKTV